MEERMRRSPRVWGGGRHGLNTFLQAEQLLGVQNESSPRIRQVEETMGTGTQVRCAQSETHLTAGGAEARRMDEDG